MFIEHLIVAFVSSKAFSRQRSGTKHNRPDMILIDSENKMYIVELTVGHESNVDRNIKRKADKYSNLLKDQRLLRTHKKVEFINLAITTGAVFSKDTKPFFTMLNPLQTNIVKYVAIRVITVCIRTSYYIFCMRERLDDTQAYGILTMHNSDD